MKIIQILSLIVENPMGIREIARKLGIPKSSVEKILKELEIEGWTIQNPSSKQFRVGNGLIDFSCKVVSSITMRELTKETISRIARETGETVYLTIKTGDCLTYIDRVDSISVLQHKIDIGVRAPLHAGSSGKVILANMGTPAVQKTIERTGLAKVGDNTITDKETLYKELELIRKRGWASSFGEKVSNVHSFSAPIFSTEGVSGSVTVAIPDLRFNSDSIPQLTNMLMERCQLISSVLISKRDKLGIADY